MNSTSDADLYGYADPADNYKARTSLKKRFVNTDLKVL